MSMMVSFVLSFFPRDVLDEILNLIESVSEDFPSYSSISNMLRFLIILMIIHCSNEIIIPWQITIHLHFFLSFQIVCMFFRCYWNK